MDMLNFQKYHATFLLKIGFGGSWGRGGCSQAYFTCPTNVPSKCFTFAESGQLRMTITQMIYWYWNGWRRNLTRHLLSYHSLLKCLPIRDQVTGKWCFISPKLLHNAHVISTINIRGLKSVIVNLYDVLRHVSGGEGAKPMQQQGSKYINSAITTLWIAII